MQKNYLVFNPGSASIRIALFVSKSKNKKNSKNNLFKEIINIYCGLNKAQKANYYNAHLKIKILGKLDNLNSNKTQEEFKFEDKSYKSILNIIFKIFKTIYPEIFQNSTIAVRIVSPGGYFLTDRIIDQEFISKLKSIEFTDPVHIKNSLELIKSLKKITKNKTKLTGISDSSFHKSEFSISKLYAIDYNLAHSEDIFRFGYHGIAAQDITQNLEIKKLNLNKFIICHLGSGSSITAIKDGKSINNSMGFSPLEGLPSSSRSGSIDPAAILYLSKVKKIKPAELIKYLYAESGLLGLSQLSDDISILEKNYNNPKYKAKLAIDLYSNKIKQYIGAYFAELNGIDAIIFTGGIGEKMPKIRRLILENLENLSIELDLEKNNKLETNNNLNIISSKNSKVKIIVYNAQEELMMAKLAKKFNIF